MHLYILDINSPEGSEDQTDVWFHIGYGAGMAILALVIICLSLKLHAVKR